MQELQSCAGLVKNGALCGGNRGCLLEFNVASSASMDCEEQEEKNGSVSNVVAKISAELQLERQRNAELLARISLLEAQLLQRRERTCLAHQDGGLNTEERLFKKFKRQRTVPTRNGFEDVEVAKNKDLAMEAKNRTLNNAVENSAQQNGLVNWMSMDDTPVFNFEKLRNEDFTSSWEESDDSEEDEDDGCGDVAEIDNNDRKIDDKSQASDTLERNLHEVCIASEGSTQYLERPPWTQNEMTFTNPSQEIDEFQNEDVSHPNARFLGLKEEHKRHKGKEVKNNKGCKMQLETLHFEKKSCKGPAGVSSNKKSLKVPFCPKEIKRVLQSEGLQLKNAQAHTIRKIIVFASLGIRHGCEDLYELDFNHFKILQKGEPYVSTKNPGEHVLYDHPGTRQKIFYPNRQNLTLCPVQILEEEKTMRPPDDSCPSCLFLCIKYGGRTRNLPQNEYVRQRMGRNKLKSFGPLMCRMAKLVHIRSGSFFFKALGITLLFMAGFSGNLVQRETKYRNLDLLQKYYRLDEEAEGEELFHSDSTLIDNASPKSKPLTGKPKKLGGKRQAGSAAKTRNSPISSGSPSMPSTTRPPSQPSQFGLTGYPSLPPSAADNAVSNVPNSISIPSLPYHIGHNSTHQYTTLLHHAANAIMPMVYWPHPNAFPPFPCTISCGYRSFPHSGSHISFRPPPYYGHSYFTPRPVEDVAKKDLEDADSDQSHDSSSSSAAPKEE